MIFIPYGTRENEPRKTFPYVTIGLALLCVAVFVYELYLQVTGGDVALENFIRHYALTPANVTDGTPLTLGLLTSMFLHAGWLHIIGNLVYFLPFGDNVEDRLGHMRYLIFYLVCGVFSAGVFAFLNPHTTAPLLGASGAIAGVLGGYLALHPHATVKGFLFIIILLIRVDLPAIVFIGYWFIIQVFSSVASVGLPAAESGGVAFVAHVGGFIMGLILAPLLASRIPMKRDMLY
jgi:membrane associated rhomboid family serine protease